MRKQKFDRTKKTLGILLLVLFVISITVTAVSAVTDTSKFGPISKQNYDKGFKEGSKPGFLTGYSEGMVSGDFACKTGKPNTGGEGVKSSLSAKSTSAYDLGYADGYNDYYPDGYSAGYTKGYDDCVDKGEQNKQLV